MQRDFSSVIDGRFLTPTKTFARVFIAQVFIDFIGYVHDTKTKFGLQGPITVHCSSGSARTGVFIALKIVLDRMHCEGVVDVFQTAKMLRTQRPAMVQTEVKNRNFFTTTLPLRLIFPDSVEILQKC